MVVEVDVEVLVVVVDFFTIGSEPPPLHAVSDTATNAARPTAISWVRERERDTCTSGGSVQHAALCRGARGTAGLASPHRR